MIKKEKVKLEKTKLNAVIRDLLQNETFETQEDICQMLQKKGFAVNQVMVSRMLHKLGAIKINEENRVVYRLPTELVAITPSNSLSQLILNISRNETLIIVRTSPGSAQLVARLLDHKKQLGILGTVAGDDTIFIAPETTKKIQTVFEDVSECLLF